MLTELERAEYIEFVQSFQQESDRGAMLIGVTFLDQQLKKVLEAYCIPGSTVTKHPLRDFAARIEVVYAVGLISQRDHGELHIMREIRNGCAHQLTHANFEAEEIVKWCVKLAIAAEISDSNVGDSPVFKGNRQIFLWAVAVLYHHLVTVAGSVQPRVSPQSRKVTFMHEPVPISELEMMEDPVPFPREPEHEIIVLAQGE